MIKEFAEVQSKIALDIRKDIGHISRLSDENSQNNLVMEFVNRT